MQTLSPAGAAIVSVPKAARAAGRPGECSHVREILCCDNGLQQVDVGESEEYDQFICPDGEAASQDKCNFEENYDTN